MPRGELAPVMIVTLSFTRLGGGVSLRDACGGGVGAEGGLRAIGAAGDLWDAWYVFEFPGVFAGFGELFAQGLDAGFGCCAGHCEGDGARSGWCLRRLIDRLTVLLRVGKEGGE